MKPIQGMDSLSRFLSNDVQIGFPHVATNERQLCRPFLSEFVEETLQRLDRTVPAYPKQSFGMMVDLVDEGQILVTAISKNLIHSNGGHP